MSKIIYLLDASMYIYRSYHAIPHLTTSTGQPTNAVYGFITTLNKILREKQPEYMVLAFDSKEPSFRREMFPEYKANRAPMPEDLIQQQDYFRRAAEALNLAQVEMPGLEADDLIATLADQALKQGFEVVIIGADKDYYQLLTDKVAMYDPNPKKESYMSVEILAERLGLSPAQFLEAQGLMGDPSDNFKGVPGVGEKTAVKLIQEYDTLENLYQNLDAIKQSKLRENIEQNRESAFLSRDLARLKKDADLSFRPERFKVTGPDKPALKRLFEELEFTSLLSDLGPEQRISYDDYHLVDTEQALADLTAELSGVTRLSVDLETTSTDPMRAEIVGVALSARPGRAFYIPVAHQHLLATQLPLDLVLLTLSPIIESAGVQKVGQNFKYDYIVLRRNGLRPSPIGDDAMIASHLIEPSARRHGLDRISKKYLNHDPITYEAVVGDKKAGFETISPDSARDYACEDADLALTLADVLHPKLAEDNLLGLYEELELPLIEVLAEMEMNGVLLDVKQLKALSAELAVYMAESEAKIYDLAGRSFNINSPRQLGQVLFEELKLPQMKKTRTKAAYSTDVEVLTKLAEGHALPAEVLVYRSWAKLRSTYAEALPLLINPVTGRVHTSYHQTGTATGRLSSSDPNLQNIPVRTEEGRRIRAAFVPEPGSLILSADYSQVELRVMAHFSGDAGLRTAFARGEDIHNRTASEIFNVPLELVSSEMRRSAKAINFGIIYGQQAFSLAKDLNIEQKTAQAYIDQYFVRYKGVKAFIDETVKEVRQEGFVTTLLNRRRDLPEIKSRNFNVRSMAERIAINTRLQGTAADIIKRAMLAIHRRLKETGIKAKMLMQVHDELVFEVEESEVSALSDLVRYEMENAADLSVPLKVDISQGLSWAEAH